MPRPRVLVGASLGGLLVLDAADGADAVVLVNPLPPVPWHVDMPARDWPDVVPWRRAARLSGTREAMPDADDATALFAFRHWRDESGTVLREAWQRGQGVTVHAWCYSLDDGLVRNLGVSARSREIRPFSRCTTSHAMSCPAAAKMT